MKRNFVNYISHEMRTPLNTVFMGIKLLQDDFILNNESQERLDVVSDIKASCDITLSTLNELLTFDKLESGMLKLELNHIPIWDFLVNTVKPFDVQAAQAGLTIIFENPEVAAEALAGDCVEGDENKLGQVIRNFVSNALKFTPRGGTVTIRTEKVFRNPVKRDSSLISALNSNSDNNLSPSVEQSTFIRIDVIDSGAGISAVSVSYPLVIVVCDYSLIV